MAVTTIGGMWKLAMVAVCWTTATTSALAPNVGESKRESGAATAAAKSGGSLGATAPGLVQFSLVPHHEVMRRRRRRRRLTEGHSNWESDEDGDEEEESEEDKWIRRRAYLRRRLGDEGEGEEGGEEDLDYQVGALYQGYGTHYVDLWVGTPPQRQTVIVDTGSSVTAFPCSECHGCGKSHHTDGYFIETESSTFVKAHCDSCEIGRCHRDETDSPCRLAVSYEEGSSWSAFEGSDMTYAGGPHWTALNVEDDGDADDKRYGDDPTDAFAFRFRLTFGCQTTLTGLFKTQLADGIMGMENNPPAMWWQMYEGDAISSRRFSLCFNRQPLLSRNGTEAGALTLGGTDVALHKSPMVFAENTRPEKGWFTVHVRRMYLRKGGGESAVAPENVDTTVYPLDMDESVLNTNGVIVDSGTTDTFFSRHLAEPFKTVWKEITGFEFTNDRMELTEEELHALPTILMQLRVAEHWEELEDKGMAGLAGDLDAEHPTDVMLAIPASHYMEYSHKSKSYSCRIHMNEWRDGGVLGANFMMGHDILFDVDQHRVGFAESDCDYQSTVAARLSESEERR